MRTRIKICGITNPSDAHTAVSAGADAIGLMFHPPSSRHLDFADAVAIRESVPPFVAAVAVTVNPSAELVNEIIRRVHPSCLQFHGEESPDFCAAFGVPYIKSVRVDEDTVWSDAVTTTAADYGTACGILVDTFHPDSYGGSGTAFDWGDARYDGAMPLILAGGLTADNVADALARVAPFGVDVSSGVESDGVKDAEKIRRFCRQVALSGAVK